MAVGIGVASAPVGVTGDRGPVVGPVPEVEPPESDKAPEVGRLDGVAVLPGGPVEPVDRGCPASARTATTDPATAIAASANCQRLVNRTHLRRRPHYPGRASSMTGRGQASRIRRRASGIGATPAWYQAVVVKVVCSPAVESPPTQTSKVLASHTQSRVAALQ